MCTRLVHSGPVLAICLVLCAGASGAEPADAAAGKEPAPTATAPENPAEFVIVTFDVSKNGRVHNARITEQSPNAISSARRKALESLRGNRFRPRLENGVTVDTVGSVKHFPIN
jgi:hypothetical protein